MNLIDLQKLSAATLLDFEDVPMLTKLTNQYLSRGVAFNSHPVIDYSGTVFGDGFAHSGNKAIDLCAAEEFCTGPLRAQFNTDQRFVKVWVGYSNGITQPISISLKAFNAQGSLVGEVFNFPATY